MFRTSRSGKLQSVADLLAKYKNIHAPQGVVVAAFIDAAEEVCGIKLSANMVRYHVPHKTIYLSFSGPRKNEIVMRRTALLAACAARLGGDAPKGIV